MQLNIKHILFSLCELLESLFHLCRCDKIPPNPLSICVNNKHPDKTLSYSLQYKPFTNRGLAITEQCLCFLSLLCT